MPDKKKKLMIIRLDVIGDFILWLGAAQYLEKIYPANEYSITLICSNKLKGFAEKFPYWNKIIFFNKERYFSNFIYRWFLRISLFVNYYDLLINTVFSRDYVGDKLIRFIRSKNKIAFLGDLSNITKDIKKYSNKFYNTLIDSPNKKSEIENNFYLLSMLSNTDFKPTLANLSPVLSEIRTYNNPYYVLIPGSRDCYKRWETFKIIELIEKIYRDTKLDCVICGNKNEIELAKHITNNSKAQIIVSAGSTDIISLCNIIRYSKFLVSNDTSAVHIAAALNIPSICIIGGGHFGRFVPYPPELFPDKNLPLCVYNKMSCYGCDWKCKYNLVKGEPYPCIKSVTTEQVWRQIYETIIF